jgi:hypothetical protein
MDYLDIPSRSLQNFIRKNGRYECTSMSVIEGKLGWHQRGSFAMATAMNTILFLTLLSCLPQPQPQAQVQPPAQPQPQAQVQVQSGALAVDSASVERGQYPRGPLLQQAFRLRHQGRQPVEILQVRSSCGCLQHHLDTQTLAPGDTATLTLTINTLSQPAGAHRWPVYIRYREGEQVNELALSVSAQLFARIDVQPAAVMIRSRGQLGSELTLQAAQPFTVRRCVVTTPALTVAPSDQTGPSQCHRLRLQVAEGLAPGEYAGFVQIETDDPLVPELAVPVRVVKLADPREPAVSVRAYPASAHLRPNHPTAVLLLRDAAGRPVVIDRATITTTAVSVQHQPGPGADATVRLTLAAGQAHHAPGQPRPAPGQATLTLHLAQPAGVTVTVPVSWGD